MASSPPPLGPGPPALPHLPRSESLASLDGPSVCLYLLDCKMGIAPEGSPEEKLRLGLVSGTSQRGELGWPKNLVGSQGSPRGPDLQVCLKFSAV